VTWYVIVVLGVVGALALGFGYVIFMRFCAGFIVWLSIVAILLVVAAFGSWCYIKSGWVPADQVNFITDFLEDLGIITDFAVVDKALNNTYAVLATLDIDVSQFTEVGVGVTLVCGMRWLDCVVVVLVVVVVWWWLRRRRWWWWWLWWWRRRWWWWY
jgi:hypothetical protein